MVQRIDRCGRPHRIQLLAVSFALFVLPALAACGSAAETPSVAVTSTPIPSTSPALTAETGGMALPGAAGGSQSAPAAETVEAEAVATVAAALPATATPSPSLAVGETFLTTVTSALYADADRAAPRFGEYPGGTQLTVLEPSGDYAGYPVTVDGANWLRVRAPDGLVGWVIEQQDAGE